MDIWQTRDKSKKWLSDDFSDRKLLIQNGYHLIDRCIEKFELISKKRGESTSGQFASICGRIVVKSKNLSLACYSLTLDGLAQEGGALLRPLIEAIELLIYIRLDNNRIVQVLDGTLPKAGTIAKSIEGIHQEVREYLNNNASHFKFTYDSIRHVLDLKTGNLKRLPSHKKKVFLANLNTLNAYQYFILNESISCLSLLDIDSNELAKEALKYRDECVNVFKIN